MISVTLAEEEQIISAFERSGYPLQALFFQNVEGERYVEVLPLIPMPQREEAKKLVMNIIFQKQTESASAQV